MIPNEETILACISWVGLPLAWLEDPQAQPQLDTLFYLQDHTNWHGWDSDLLTEKRLAGAVVPRLEATETTPPEEATSAAEVFQSTYQFIRPAP